jgi:hypothetical protein
MNRTPPIAVRRQLRKEIGFGCPVPGCGNPYLYYHHFDPTWAEKQHHDPKGMIALCAEHHSKADAGTYTKEQLLHYKLYGQYQNKNIANRFDWMRNRILVVLGNGIFVYETYTILKYKNMPIIWLNRDINGYLLLNILMDTSDNESKLIIENNNWISIGNPEDIECPPSGKILKVKYKNGEMIQIKFIEIKSKEEYIKRYPDNDIWEQIEFPITVIEVHIIHNVLNIKCTSKETSIQGITFQNFSCLDGDVVFDIN